AKQQLGQSLMGHNSATSLSYIRSCTHPPLEVECIGNEIVSGTKTINLPTRTPGCGAHPELVRQGY
ncbi:MAG: hypothetical protein ACXVIF_05295, partial [Halobacteriota archaeon]